MRKPLQNILWIAISCLSCLQAHSGRVTESEIAKVGAEVYTFGYPLVVMGTAKDYFTSAPKPSDYRAPINQFAHQREFAGPDFEALPSPNMDVLYSTAWLDLSEQPWVLHIPAIADRYFLFTLLDGWTNVIASLSPRTISLEAQNYLIAGPKFKDEVPENMILLRSNTDMAWLIGRTQCYGPTDYAQVRAIQNQYTLVPLASFGNKYSPPTDVPVKTKTPVYLRESPAVQVADMDSEAFFGNLSGLLASNPPTRHDAPMVEKMKMIGLSVGKPYDTEDINPLYEGALGKSVESAKASLSSRQQSGKIILNYWNFLNRKVGDYGTDYALREVVASIALGADRPEDVLYPFTSQDNSGMLLTGLRKYVLHFPKDQLPPVDAFWSLTLYDEQHRLSANPINRYALHAFNDIVYDTLEYEDDGSLNIFIQHTEPKNQKNNWLPCPRGNFNLMLRLYWPEAKALDGSWLPPPVTCMDPLN